MNWQPGPIEEPVEVGDRFLVLVQCLDTRLRYTYWDLQVIVATESGWDDSNGEYWDAWSPDDIEWYIKLDRDVLPPLT